MCLLPGFCVTYRSDERLWEVSADRGHGFDPGRQAKVRAPNCRMAQLIASAIMPAVWESDGCSPEANSASHHDSVPVGWTTESLKIVAVLTVETAFLTRSAGPYGRIRHPIYSGIILGMAGTAIAVSPYWLTAVAILGAYFLVSAVIEERTMAKLFPRGLPPYKRATKMLIPLHPLTASAKHPLTAAPTKRSLPWGLFRAARTSPGSNRVRGYCAAQERRITPAGKGLHRFDAASDYDAGI